MATITTTPIRAIESDNTYTRYEATVLVDGDVYARIDADRNLFRDNVWSFHTDTRMNREHDNATAAAEFLRTDALAGMALATLLDQMNTLIPEWNARYDAERARFLEMAKEREARQAAEKKEWDKTHGSVTVKYEGDDTANPGWVVAVEDGGHTQYADNEFFVAMSNDLMHEFMSVHKTQGDAIEVAKKVIALKMVRKHVTHIDVYTAKGDYKSAIHKEMIRESNPSVLA